MGTSVGKSRDTVIDNTDYNPNTENDAWNIRRRYVGLAAIWSNPNAGDTGCARQQTYSTSQRVRKFSDAGRPYSDGSILGLTVRAPNNGDEILATDLDNARRIVGEGVNAVNQAFLNSTTGFINYPTGYASRDQQIDASHINNLIATIIVTESKLDIYNSYYDGADLCARSCQIACQTACQTSCQGCNTSQCHNQKCGVH